MEIRLAEVEPMAEIAIRTRNSCYIFCVTEPKGRRGFLSGGRLGPRPRQAFLANTFLATNRFISKKDQLVVGYLALFYLDDTGPDIIVTSVITGLEIAPRPAGSSPEDC